MIDYRNLADIADQLRAAGLVLDSVKKANGGTLVGDVYVESVRSVRCDVAGEKKKGTGAYRLHEIRLSDGVWLTGAYWLDHGPTSYALELRKTCGKCGADIPLKGAICPACGAKKFKSRDIPQEQMEAHKKRMAELRRQAEADAKAAGDRAAAWANAVWRKCIEHDEPTGPGDYIARKKLKSAHGARIFPGNDDIMLEGAEKEDYEYLARFAGARVVPMCDEKGNRRALQFILDREKHKDWIARRDGKDKTYWPEGMQNDGLHFIIGGAMHRVGLVCEGFATGVSLHEESGVPVAVAFDAGGVPKVGEVIWKAKKKRVHLLYCADDDWIQKCQHCKGYTPVETAACRHCGQPHGKANAGVDKAKEAALTTSGAWTIPKFSVPRPDDKKGDTDFNDLRVAEGPGPVRVQIETKLAELGWQPASGGGLPPSGSGPSSPGGAGAPERDARCVLNLDDLVERFMPIYCGNGKLVFDTWKNKLAHRDQMMALAPPGTNSDEIKRHPTWAGRRLYDLEEVGFDPAGTDPDVKLNTWRGWPLTPKEGCCDRLIELLAYLCSGEGERPELVQWVLRWMAYPLQHPGAKMQSAIILHGPQGTGKSTVFQALAKIYGKYSTVLNQRGLEDKFNSDWADSKLFILAEEVVTRAEMWHIKNELKELVTGEVVRINPKNIAAYEQKNHINIAYCSNENQPLPIDNDDRRHCVIYTPPPVAPEFYDEVRAELSGGGVEAFYHYLLTLDLGDHKPWTKPPMTDAKLALIQLSLPSELRFIQDYLAGDTRWPVCPCRSSDFYDAYARWCRENGETRPRPSNQFFGAITRLPGWEKKKARYHEDEQALGDAVSKPVVFPPAKALAEHGNAQPPGKSVPAWLTACIHKFSGAGRKDERWAA